MSFQWFGDAILARIIAGVDKRVLDCAYDLQGRSIDEAPVDMGDLRGNCTVNETDEHSVEIGYDLPYARIQHEALEFNHPKGGKAKYLEDPFNANKERYIKRVGSKGLI